MTRRQAAIIGSLILAPAGPLILGHYPRVASSFAVEVLAVALFVVGARWNLPWLLLLSMLVALLNRAAMVRAAIKLGPATRLPGLTTVVLSLVFLCLLEDALPSMARAHLVEAFKIPAGSMIPTLQVGDHIFVDKRATLPKRGDVIVFKYPREPEKDFVKRVIAVGGDTVEWRDGIPVVNGQPILRRALEGECQYVDYDSLSDRWDSRRCRAFEETLDGRNWRVFQDPSGFDSRFAPVVVPPGAYYVLGDNRDNSHDSRFWGSVPASLIKGTVLAIWWSSDGRGLHTERIGMPVR
jgi:signal peptidase I